jgi:excinuclease ABC subunit B
MYADRITDSMQLTIDETNRRREIQMQYNKDHNKVPQALNKKIKTKFSCRDFEENPYEQKHLIQQAAEINEKLFDRR